MSVLISGKNISLQYPKEQNLALNNISFEIPKSRVTLFLGKSGSGKTSLLKSIANLIKFYSGDILFENQNIKTFSRKERAKSIGYVAQSFNLFPHLNILENCVQPQRLVLSKDKSAAREKALSLLDSLDISNLSHKKPGELSGGQAQRVAIARVLCMDAKALLLDEPTSALDPESTQNLAKIIRQLIKENISIAISTHDMSFARSIFEHGYFIESGKIAINSDEKLKAYLEQ